MASSLVGLVCTWPKLGVEAAPNAGAEPPPKPPNVLPELPPKLGVAAAALDAGAPKDGVLSAPKPPDSVHNAQSKCMRP